MISCFLKTFQNGSTKSFANSKSMSLGGIKWFTQFEMPVTKLTGLLDFVFTYTTPLFMLYILGFLVERRPVKRKAVFHESFVYSRRSRHCDV